MADEKSPKKLKTRDFTGPDAVLQLYASVAQDTPEFELAITLNVSGAVITGTLIGRTAWIEQQSAAYADQLGSVVSQLARLIDNDQAEDVGLEEYGWLHLKDARYVFGEAFMPAIGGGSLFWRGRLVDVSGWSIGVIGRGPVRQDS